MIETDNVS